MFSTNNQYGDSDKAYDDFFSDSFQDTHPSEPRSLIHNDDMDNSHFNDSLFSNQFGNQGGLDLFGGNMMNPFGNMGMAMNSDGGLQVHEKADKYIVEMKDIGDIEGKEFSIDYQKALNQIVVNMNKTSKSGDGVNSSYSTSSSQKSVGFDQPVDYNNITSDVQGGSLIVTVPKSDQLVQIDDGDSDNFIEGIATTSGAYATGEDRQVDAQDGKTGYIEDVESSEEEKQ